MESKDRSRQAGLLRCSFTVLAQTLVHELLEETLGSYGLVGGRSDRCYAVLHCSPTGAFRIIHNRNTSDNLADGAAH